MVYKIEYNFLWVKNLKSKIHDLIPLYKSIIGDKIEIHKFGLRENFDKIVTIQVKFHIKINYWN